MLRKVSQPGEDAENRFTHGALGIRDPTCMRKWWLSGYSLAVLFLSLGPFPLFSEAARVSHPTSVFLTVGMRRGLFYRTLSARPRQTLTCDPSAGTWASSSSRVQSVGREARGDGGSL